MEDSHSGDKSGMDDMLALHDRVSSSGERELSSTEHIRIT